MNILLHKDSVLEGDTLTYQKPVKTEQIFF